jgi:uridine kinase
MSAPPADSGPAAPTPDAPAPAPRAATAPPAAPAPSAAAPCPQAVDPDALAHARLLSGLSPDELRRLGGWAERVEVPADTHFLREGDESRDLYLVLSGDARLRRHRLALKAIGPGDHFGALALLTGRPRTTSVVSRSRMVLARVSPAAWGALAAREPALAMRVVLALLGEVRDDLVEMTDSVGALLQGRSLPRAREVTVQVGDAARVVRTGTPMRAVLPADVDGAVVVAGLIGQKPVSLSTPLFSDARVAPLTVRHGEGRRVYTQSVGLLLLEAAARVAPDVPVRLGPSRGPVQVVEGVPAADRSRLVEPLLAEMRRLVAADLPYRQEVWTLEEAARLFQERGWSDAASILRTRREGTVPLVTLGAVHALSPGPLLPSSGLAGEFGLRVAAGELLLDYGRLDLRNGGSAHPAPGGPEGPPPHDGGMVEEHRAWLAAQSVTSVGAFNDLCVSGQVSQLIRVAEGFHEKRIGRVADEVAARRDRIRIVTVAGPSSSGKTTFIKRLVVQLEINGLRPLGVSLDDYYVDRERTVRGPDGDYDFEALEALDLPLLHDHLRRLLAGGEVQTARYDFKAGRSDPGGGPRIRLEAGSLLLLEGIHGLNPRLLGDIPAAGEVFRVFIHPATTLPFDRLSRFSATDLRLLRRIVRDRHARGYGAAANIARWPSVQRGELLHIFPFQGEADAVFDSSLAYEPAVLKVYAERYLLEVPPDDPAYPTAIRLRHLVDRFVSIYPDHVPPTSILREFIGGSGFEY